MAQQDKAPHEAESTAAPAGDQPSLLAESPYPEEALGYFEHQLGDCLGLAVSDGARPWLCVVPMSSPPAHLTAPLFPD
jgi:hypothetical protein